MSVQTQIFITHAKEALGTIRAKVLHPQTKPKEELAALINYLNGVRGGDRDAKLVVQINSGDFTTASGTVTLASFAATNTITIAGVAFAGVASGPTGNQFLIGANDTATAVNAVAAINSLTSGASASVIASSVGAVITLKCQHIGKIGNYVPLAISAGGTVSGAALTGGADATTYSVQNTYRSGV